MVKTMPVCRVVGDTVFHCIAHHCQADADRLCLGVREGQSWKTFTRGEFWREIERYTRLFRQDFQAGSLVLFVKQLDSHLLAGYLGAMRAGLLPAQISYPSSKVSPAEYQRKLAHILQLTGAGAIFTDPYAAERFRGFPDLVVLTPVDAGIPSGAGASAQDVLAEGASAESTPGEEALVQFSSGSTGLQKGVVLTHSAIVRHMRHYSEALEIDDQDVLVSWLPLYHDMGLIACYLMPLMCGIPFFQMDPFDWLSRPELLFETIAARKGTLCFLPNFAYHVLAGKARGHDLGSTRLFVNCSEPALPQTHAIFREQFPTVQPGALGVCYALAEGTFAVTQTIPGQVPAVREIEGRSVISCGRPIAGVETTILEANPAGVGEIAIRGDHLFCRTLSGAAESHDGFYRTGDLGYLSGDGELYVTGRKKDILIVNGKNLYPHDIENATSRVAGVYPGRVVAFGQPNPAVGSEELYVVLERAQGSPLADVPLKIAVQKAVEAEVGIIPRRVEVLAPGTLVKTSSGKISRSRNRELYQSGELQQTANC